jgi:hypothetical protein
VYDFLGLISIPLLLFGCCGVFLDTICSLLGKECNCVDKYIELMKFCGECRSTNFAVWAKETGADGDLGHPSITSSALSCTNCKFVNKPNWRFCGYCRCKSPHPVENTETIASTTAAESHQQRLEQQRGHEEAENERVARERDGVERHDRLERERAEQEARDRQEQERLSLLRKAESRPIVRTLSGKQTNQAIATRLCKTCLMARKATEATCPFCAGKQEEKIDESEKSVKEKTEHFERLESAKVEEERRAEQERAALKLKSEQDRVARERGEKVAEKERLERFQRMEVTGLTNQKSTTDHDRIQREKAEKERLDAERVRSDREIAEKLRLERMECETTEKDRAEALVKDLAETERLRNEKEEQLRLLMAKEEQIRRLREKLREEQLQEEREKQERERADRDASEQQHGDGNADAKNATATKTVSPEQPREVGIDDYLLELCNHELVAETKPAVLSDKSPTNHTHEQRIVTQPPVIMEPATEPEAAKENPATAISTPEVSISIMPSVSVSIPQEQATVTTTQPTTTPTINAPVVLNRVSENGTQTRSPSKSLNQLNLADLNAAQNHGLAKGVLTNSNGNKQHLAPTSFLLSPPPLLKPSQRPDSGYSALFGVLEDEIAQEESRSTHGAKPVVGRTQSALLFESLQQKEEEEAEAAKREVVREQRKQEVASPRTLAAQQAADDLKNSAQLANSGQSNDASTQQQQTSATTTTSGNATSNSFAQWQPRGGVQNRPTANQSAANKRRPNQQNSSTVGAGGFGPTYLTASAASSSADANLGGDLFSSDDSGGAKALPQSSAQKPSFGASTFSPTSGLLAKQNSVGGSAASNKAWGQVRPGAKGKLDGGATGAGGGGVSQARNPMYSTYSGKASARSEAQQPKNAAWLDEFFEEGLKTLRYALRLRLFVCLFVCLFV